MEKLKITVLGAGTWGMALARMLSLSGQDVTVWSALSKEVETYPVTRRHPNLPGMVIPEEIAFDGDIACCQRHMRGGSPLSARGADCGGRGQGH